MADTEIYYVSGTGNSLFAARELSRRIPDSRIEPLVPRLGKGRIRLRCRVLGLAFPVHALSVPIAVSRFVRDLDPKGVEYVFALATRGAGTAFYGFEKLDRLLTRRGRGLDSAFLLDLGNSDSRHGVYATPTLPDLQALEHTALEVLDRAAAVIREGRSAGIPAFEVTTPTHPDPRKARFLDRVIVAGHGLSEHIGGVNYFYHDQNCNGCGICGRVCLSGKIRFASGMPRWDRGTLCYMCFACLNFCPRKAVQIRSIPFVESRSPENGRYPHPYATIADMEEQKIPAVDSSDPAR